MRSKLLQLLMCFVACCWVFSIHSQPLSHIEERYNELHALEQGEFDNERARADAISSSYERLFPGIKHPTTGLESISTQDLDFVLKAAYLAAFYTFKVQYLSDIQAITTELDRRNSLNDDQRLLLHRSLVGYRKFALAQEISARTPHLKFDEVPQIDGTADAGKGPVIYKLDLRQFSMHAENIALPTGVVVVAVVHPLCAFSRAATTMIASDPDLSAALGNAIWLAPPDMRLYFDEVQEWNRNNPSIPIFITHHPNEWPMIDRWTTPQFYLIREGVVVDKFSGWPKAGNRERLVELLARGGWTVPEQKKSAR